MRMFIFLFLFPFSLFASQYLMNYNNSHYCINSYSIKNNSNWINIVLSSDNKSYNLILSPSDIYSGYDYNSSNGTCNLIKPLKKLGLTFNEYNFLIALTAVLFGFVVLFFMIYIVLIVGG